MKSTSPRANSSKPNILIILADDMGYGDLNCQNADSKIPTPQLDRLASQGMRFSDAHAPSSVCTPTRYALLTGRYAWRTYLKSGVLGPYNAPLIEDDRPTLPKLLQSNGYNTACIGKWHLGFQWGTHSPDDEIPRTHDPDFDQGKIDLGKPIAAGPNTIGFDYFFGMDCPNFPPYCYIENDHIVGPIPTKLNSETVTGARGLMQDGWNQHAVLPELKSRSIRFLEDQAKNPGTPFFLFLSLTTPHRPIVPNKEWQGVSGAGDYGDLVAETDGMIGDVLATLDKERLAENTIVIFASDNGSCGPAGESYLRPPEWCVNMSVTTLFDHHPNAPWRGKKAETYEGGHRIPLLIRWPEVIQAGSVNDHYVCLSDMFRTIADVTDLSMPEGAAEDSISNLPTWKDPSVAVRDHVIMASARNMLSVRKGTWKYIEGRGPGGFLRSDDPDPSTTPPGQLYDLASDPKETINLYEDHPKVVSQLQTIIDRARQGKPSPSSI